MSKEYNYLFKALKLFFFLIILYHFGFKMMIVVLGIESIESIESIYYCVALLSGVSQEEYLQFYKG